MLTLEFAIVLTPAQAQSIGEWMDVLKHQWNLGLSALEEYDRFSWYDKVSKKSVLVCPIAEGAWIKDEKRVALTCSLVQDPAPRLTSSALQAGGNGLSIMARSDMIPDFLKVTPSKFRLGMLALLSASWDAYAKDRKGHGKPRYKRRKESWDILYSGNLKSELKVKGDRLLGIPKLGEVEVPHLNQRWKDSEGEVPPICAFKIVRRGGGFRVQLTGDLKRRYPVKPSNQSIGFDLGFIYAHTGSNGERAPLYSAAEEKMEAKKRKLQAQVDAKLDQRLILWLHHPETDLEATRQLIRVSVDTWAAMEQCVTAGALAQVIGQKRDKRYQSLRHKLPRSNAEKDLRKAIATIDRKMSGSRKVRDHKFATRISKKYGHIAIENGLQSVKLRERPEPILNESGGFDQNGAERQSDLNQQLRSLAPGQKISIMEQRTARYGRSFERAESFETTSECPVCGTQNTPDLEMDITGDREYLCAHCSWRCDQDINAAVNIELRSFAFVPHVVLTPWAERARIRSYQVEADGSMKFPPLWRKSLADRATEKSSRSSESRGQSDSGTTEKKKRTRLSGASHKSQLKARPATGSAVVQ